MKIANVSWGWTPIPEDTPHGDSLIKIADQIRELGFEAVDYLGTPEALDVFFNEKSSTELGEHSRKIGLEPNVFVFQDAVWNNPMAPSLKQSYRLPADYCFQKDWDLLIDSYKKALAIAKKYGLRMSIECFPHSMISTPHAMLKVLEDVGDDDFGIQLDTNHLIDQHIDPEWTIYVLGGKRIFNVHCKDNDSISRGNIPAGCGICDYTAVIQALKNVGYQGNLAVELEFTDNPRRYNKQALEHLKLCVAGEY